MKGLKYCTIGLAIALCSCANNKDQNIHNQGRNSQKSIIVNYVDTMVLRKSTFNKQIICNGKLRAIEKCDLVFSTSGVLSKINAHNGKIVKKGDLLAVLDISEAKIALKKAHKMKEKGWTDLVDKLIGQGYNSDTTNVPKEVMAFARMSSGYDAAVEGLEDAKRNLEKCYLYAPFNGKIADMDSRLHQSPANGKLCSLINDDYFNVEFSVLEAEIKEIAVGQVVDVALFIDESTCLEGKITEINPTIDDKGQIKVRARVKNQNNQLIDGMNIMLTLNKKIEDQYVVPKDAVLARDGHFVVFCYRDGKAVWNYVDIVMSNVDYHVIEGSKAKHTIVSSEDIIIIDGNLNLADGTNVEIKE